MLSFWNGMAVVWLVMTILLTLGIWWGVPIELSDYVGLTIGWGTVSVAIWQELRRPLSDQGQGGPWQHPRSS